MKSVTWWGVKLCSIKSPTPSSRLKSAGTYGLIQAPIIWLWRPGGGEVCCCPNILTVLRYTYLKNQINTNSTFDISQKLHWKHFC